MTAQMNPLLLQLILKDTKLSSVLVDKLNHEMPLEMSSLNSNMNQIVQQQLIQAIIQQRIKNQILMNTLALKQSLNECDINKTFQKTVRNVAVVKQISQLAGTPKEIKHITLFNNQSYIKLEDYSQKLNVSTQEEQKEKPLLGTTKKIKNETKNIPKNFGKAIISFIEKNSRLVKRIISKHPHLQYHAFMLNIKLRKKTINSIADLRSLWIEEENIFAKPLRILSHIFLKKHSLSYIFNSRVSNYEGHIKYRNRLMDALKNPKTFTCIKVF